MKRGINGYLAVGKRKNRRVLYVRGKGGKATLGIIGKKKAPISSDMEEGVSVFQEEGENWASKTGGGLGVGEGGKRGGCRLRRWEKEKKKNCRHGGGEKKFFLMRMGEKRGDP